MERKLELSRDLDIKLNPSQMAIIKKAKNEGIYDVRIARQKILQSDNSEKMIKQMLGWNKDNVSKLVEAGILIPKDPYRYELRSDYYERFMPKWEPKPNHIKLIQKHIDGKLITKEIRKDLPADPALRKRQANILNGMLKNLEKQGYIRKTAPGEYVLLSKGLELCSVDLSKIERKRKRIDKGVFKLTKFDRHILEVSKNGKINKELLEKHIKKDSITKRIKSLQKHGFIDKNGTLSEAFVKLIEKKKEIDLSGKKLSLDILTPRQKEIMRDLRVFQNISREQLLKYFYKGNSQALEIEIEYLIQNDIIRVEPNTGIYILGKAGIELTNGLDSGYVKYTTKLFGKVNELKHDMKLYDAYRVWKKQAEEKGYKVISLKNDRQLRKDYAKKYGSMQGSFPDLRVYYTNNKGQLYKYDIEMDCGYDASVILRKAGGLIKTSRASLKPGTVLSGNQYSFKNGTSIVISSPSSKSKSYSGKVNKGGIKKTINRSNTGGSGQISSKDVFASGTKMQTSTSSKEAAAQSRGVLWYCDTVTQAARVARQLSKATGESKRNTRRKKQTFTVSYMDENGNMRVMIQKDI